MSIYPARSSLFLELIGAKDLETGIHRLGATLAMAGTFGLVAKIGSYRERESIGYDKIHSALIDKVDIAPIIEFFASIHDFWDLGIRYDYGLLKQWENPNDDRNIYRKFAVTAPIETLVTLAEALASDTTHFQVAISLYDREYGDFVTQSASIQTIDAEKGGALLRNEPFFQIQRDQGIYPNIDYTDDLTGTPSTIGRAMVSTLLSLEGVNPSPTIERDKREGRMRAPNFFPDLTENTEKTIPTAIFSLWNQGINTDTFEDEESLKQKYGTPAKPIKTFVREWKK